MLCRFWKRLTVVVVALQHSQSVVVVAAYSVSARTSTAHKNKNNQSQNHNMLIRVRSNVGTWKVQLEPTQTIQDLLQDAQFNAWKVSQAAVGH
jgi:uncharacterized protein YpmS